MPHYAGGWVNVEKKKKGKKERPLNLKTNPKLPQETGNSTTYRPKEFLAHRPARTLTAGVEADCTVVSWRQAQQCTGKSN